MSELDNCCGTTCDKQLLRSEVAALQKDRDERVELAIRLHNEVSLKQLEIDHCHAVCDELRQKLDSMTAHIEVLGDKLSEVVALLYVDVMTAVQWLLDNCPEIESLTDMEPQHHLREVRADAGRDGFIAGYFHYKNYGFQFEEELEAASKQYHASILAGKE